MPIPRRTLLASGIAAGVGALLPATARADDPFEFVIDCDSWGARPPAGTLFMNAHRTRKIVVHHMAFPNVTDYSREHALQLARDCQDLHMDHNGWSDTGQHFTVSRGGYVLEGRHRSLEGLRSGAAQVTSAHCVGENTQSIGIENEGTYVTETPPAALLDSLVKLSVTICSQYGIHAHNMFGHWDYNNTDCPGIAFYRLFPEIRRRVATTLGTPLADVPARVWPDVFSSNAGAVVATAKKLLINQGYALTPDVYYDGPMIAAIQDWQRTHGFEVASDGTMTDPTWETLGVFLANNDSGAAVEGLQQILLHKGYEVTVNGEYDHDTHKAVQAMQKLHGLIPNGKVDTDTWCAVVGGIVQAEFTGVLS
ncbi:peptidoglycan recognition protein family protein [Hamadaea tsunoensis]|uniref:peptidoglycan recognition protein family protein n=1 Tax=Hamadaea tsunoensis TaxID=53368 RepID=UPI00040133D4|nr:peptidoglycan-binding protein [Hamadaea tsunoensis]